MNTTIGKLASDKRLIVRYGGVEFDKLAPEVADSLGKREVHDRIAFYFDKKLLTINSRDPSAPVWELGRAKWMERQEREESLERFERQYQSQGYVGYRGLNNRRGY